MLTIRKLLLVALLIAGPAVAQDFQTTESGLQWRTIRQGTGPEAKPGHAVLVHEVTKKEDGTVVTDTFAMNHPLRFDLGAGQVIAGFEEGVTGMKVGEIRNLVVPPALSQRKTYPDSLSPDDVLHYEVLLIKVYERETE